MKKTRVPGLDPRTASGWLLKAFDTALKRDPVDAANDAEYLAALLSQRAADLAETNYRALLDENLTGWAPIMDDEERRTRELEAEGMPRGDAQGIVEAEALKRVTEVELSEGERAILGHIAGITR